MADKTPQTAPEPTLTPQENSISEPTSQHTAPSEHTEPTSIPPIEPAPVEVPPEPIETTPSPESATPVKDDISANEPLNSAPESETPSEPNSQSITVEKHGTDTTITEVMEQPETPTAQMGASEPLADWQAEKRAENLKLANETRQEKKRGKINKILTLFSEQSQITNDEVEKLLHVSDATATRYLDELEKEGKIKQVGKTGKHTHYEKI